MKIVFMGTPQFAIPSLSRLVSDGHEVAAVYCQPDKPQGRGMALSPPPVKQKAVELGIRVIQPKGFKSEQVREELCAISPDLIVVAAYGKILPEWVLNLPKYGCINVHGSILPKYRGAAPIQWAVINGETETGVTIMKMAKGLDTGDMLYCQKTAIFQDETAGELYDRLAEIGAQALSFAIENLDSLSATPQDDSLACWAPPLAKEDGLLSFTKPADELYNLIRGVTPQPGAWTMLFGKRLKVHQAKPCELCGKPGELLDQKRLIVAAGDKSLELLLVQPEGSKRMDGASLINGKRLKKGDILFTL